MTTEIIKAAAEYVAGTQPALQKLAAFEAKVPELVDALIQAGLVEAHMKSAKVKQLIGDPSLACDVTRQALTTVKVASVGVADMESIESNPESADDIFASRMLNG